jgi:hypothetical protein
MNGGGSNKNDYSRNSRARNILAETGAAYMLSTGIDTVTREELAGDQVSMVCAASSPCSDRENEHVGPIPASIFSRVMCALLDHFPRLQRVLWECGSFLRRIQIALSSSYIDEVPTGFVWLDGNEGFSYLNTRSFARSEHIEKIASTLPWATPLDWQTHLQSWEAGVEWAVRNLSSGSSLPDEQKALLSSELTYQGPKQL